VYRWTVTPRERNWDGTTKPTVRTHHKQSIMVPTILGYMRRCFLSPYICPHDVHIIEPADRLVVGLDVDSSIVVISESLATESSNFENVIAGDSGGLKNSRNMNETRIATVMGRTAESDGSS